MIIDFHTHIFPDKIAGKTIEHLSGKAKIPPYSDGSRAGLEERIREAGVDIAINLPVLTSPSQFDSVTAFAKELNLRFSAAGKGVLSFAGIHPSCDDVCGKMKYIASLGFLGVKIHPDYQETFIDDERYVRIVDEARKNDLIVVIHSGVDGGYPDSPVRCTPKRALSLIRETAYEKLVFAHLGANEMQDEVLDTLCGENVYFDTAYVLRRVERSVFMRILEKHGADRILFASDSPWSDIKEDVERLRSFSLERETEEKIFFRNAQRLLGI